jgi:hypothetical protein
MIGNISHQASPGLSRGEVFIDEFIDEFIDNS